MLDKLFDIFHAVWEEKPYVIIMQYQRGVFYRFGKYKRTIPAGMYGKIPLIDHVSIHSIAWETIELDVQSFNTSDNKSVSVKGIVKFRITNVAKYDINVLNAKSAISDVIMGIIINQLKDKTWADIRGGHYDEAITSAAKDVAKDWGIKVSTVTLVDIVEGVSVRLFGNQKGIVE
jgi:regulator of protease activity HflC (stomatin/prohibitin superfamily)